MLSVMEPTPLLGVPVTEVGDQGFPISLLPYVQNLHLHGSHGDLALQDYSQFKVVETTRLPSKYNGNIVFELPSLDPAQCNDSREELLHYDGHPWLQSNHIGVSNLPEGVRVR